MSNLSPDFTLPINFALIRRMLDHSGPFLYRQPRLSTRKRIFANSWICVAHGSGGRPAERLHYPGDHRRNIVIVRGRDNILRAFYNVTTATSY